jgi:disulfide bond formation protein DsbB
MTADARPATALALIAAAMLAAAFGFEHLGGLAPCALCWWQRYAWMAALGPACAAIAAARHAPRAATALLLLAALAALAGAAIAFFHVGVEQGWWEGTAACGSALGQGLSAEERLRRILAAPVVRCTDIPWSMLGISMAGWNGIVALGGGGLALRAALRQVLGAKR